MKHSLQETCPPVSLAAIGPLLAFAETHEGVGGGQDVSASMNSGLGQKEGGGSRCRERTRQHPSLTLRKEKGAWDRGKKNRRGFILFHSCRVNI